MSGTNSFYHTIFVEQDMIKDPKSLSFLHRSVGMDAWSQDQLRKMQLGGNDKLNDFFSKYGISKTTDIKEKYNSTAAEVRQLGTC